MNKSALIALVISLSLTVAPLAHAQTEQYVEVPPDAESITYNDAANCSDAQGIVSAAQRAANERIADVNNVVKNIGKETRMRRACIENLMAILTFTIPTFPSLTAIITQLVQAFIQNLIGKACAAATNAINGAIGQVNEQIRNGQNAIDGITAPLKPYQNGGSTIGGGAASGANAAIQGAVSGVPTPSQIFMMQSKAAAAGQTNEAINTVREQIAGGSPPVSAPQQSAKAAPAPVPTPAPAKQGGGWKGVSCAIFGGC